jgi:hypothetical protein
MEGVLFLVCIVWWWWWWALIWRVFNGLTDYIRDDDGGDSNDNIGWD